MTLGQTVYPEYRPSCCFVNPQAIKLVDVLNTKDKALQDTNASSVQQPLSIFGLEKYEVLALLVSSFLALIFVMSVLMDIISRIGNQPNIHT